MKVKKIGSLILIVLGLVLIAGSLVINAKVKEGQEQVSSAEKKVDTGDKLFSIAPGGQGIGETLSEPIQKKIEEGKGEIAFYTAVAKWLEIGGIVVLVLGACLILMRKKSRS